MASKLRRIRTRMLLLLLHLGVIFGPIGFIAIASNSMKVNPIHIQLTALFAAAAVAVDVCWSAFIRRIEVVDRLSEESRYALSQERRAELEVQIAGASDCVKWYCFLGLVTLGCWGLIAYCEVLHVKHLAHVEELARNVKSLKTEIAKTTESFSGLINLSAILGGFIVLLAIAKLFVSTFKTPH